MRDLRSPIWASDGVVLIAEGEVTRFDPGTGPNRYRRASEALATSGRDRAVASFTFDPDHPGSVVEIPESVVAVPASELPGRRLDPPQMRLIDDGVADWDAAFSDSLEAIESDMVEKLVLSRQVRYEVTGELQHGDLVADLVTREPGCHVFSVDGLIGASPELLVSLRSGVVSSLALAGTSPDVDGLATDKMEREHELSRSSVVEGLSTVVEGLEVDERTVRRFGAINHLATSLRARAAEGVGILDLVASLHPTAAVAGSPSDTSLKLIDDLERRPRGRYAGPVGWFDVSGEGEFAIALRCGLFRDIEATLFAGGGIVRGSERDSELAETDLKLRPMLTALGQNG